MDSVDARINRVIGQLRGIGKMIDEKRDCALVLQQISAVKKAIDGLTKELVVSDICQYVPKEKAQQVKDMVEQAIKL